VPSPIVRDTIKKLKARRAMLQKQVKGPLEELAQIEQDLIALGGAGRPARGATAAGRAAGGQRAAPHVNQAAILRAVRNGATEPAAIAEKTGLPTRSVAASVTNYINKQKLLVRGQNGLTLTKAGRDRLRELEAA
jgi:hypothetical protein